MTILANIPVWAYFVILALMFMTTHLLAMKPERTPKRATAIARGGTDLAANWFAVSELAAGELVVSATARPVYSLSWH